MGKELDVISKLGSSVKRGINSVTVISDSSEGAGQQTKKVTAKVFHDEMASVYQGMKSHEIGYDNTHTANLSLAYGTNLITGIIPRAFTCSAGSSTLVVTGMDVTDDFRTGDAVRIYIGDGTRSYDRVVKSSTFSTHTTIVYETSDVEPAIANITSGTIVNHSHGQGVINIGADNIIKGDNGVAIGSGLEVLRDVIGFSLSGLRNKLSHSGTRGAGQDGNSHWTGEDYLAAVMTASKGDAKASTVMMKALTTDDTPTQLTTPDGRKLLLPAGMSALFEIKAVGTQTGGAGGTAKDTYVTHIRGSVKNIAGAITIIDQEVAYTSGDVAMAGAITVTEDDTLGGINIIATGEATKNITWTAKVELVLNIAA